MTTVVVAAAVCWHEGRVLLTRRPDKGHLAGLWEFPGGKVEEDEDPVDTVVRECKEEMGVTLRVGDILNVTFHRYEHKNVLLLFYDCWLGEGVHPDDIRHLEIQAHAWVEARDVRSYELPPPDDAVVARIVERGPTGPQAGR